MIGAMEPPDPHSVLRALGVDDVTAVAPVEGGTDTTIWRIEQADAVFALRVFRPESAARCDREVAAMEAARAAGVPVPIIQARCVWQDRPVLLLSWCAGRPVFHQVLARPWRAVAYGRIFGRTQATIHQAPAPGELSKAGDRWLDGLLMEAGLRGVLHEASGSRGCLLHLDYHPLNVMADENRITGVLDWANAHVSDPRIDIARTRTILRLDMGMLGRPAFATAPSRVIWRLFEEGWWRGYREVSPLEGGLAPYYAAAGVLMQQDLGGRYTHQQLASVRKWTARWTRRALFSTST